MRGFLSDNASGVHPAVLEALAKANVGHALPYGEDEDTLAMERAMDELFGRKVHAFTVFNGTGANVTALSHLTQRYSCVLCSDCAHIFDDECGAPEHFMGCKMMGLQQVNGKVLPAAVEESFSLLGSQHSCQPAVLSISQLTEHGTAYNVDEIRMLADLVHAHGLYLHVDGARIANALANSDVSIAEMIADTGVDALSFGMAKNGMLFGEAVMFFDEKLGKTFPFTRKNSGQLFSKGRFIAAQVNAMLADDLWLKLASHANAMARELARKLSKVPGITIDYAVEGNEVFCQIPKVLADQLMKEVSFSEHGSAYRFVCSFDTTQEDIDHLVTLAHQYATVQA